MRFVITGLFRSFYYSDLGDEITYCFTFSDNLISAHSSFITGKETPENIQAITDSKVLLFSKKDFEAIVKSNPNCPFKCERSVRNKNEIELLPVKVDRASFLKLS